MKRKLKRKKDQAPTCACGCGSFVQRSKVTGEWNKFIIGHNNKRQTKHSNDSGRSKNGQFTPGNKIGRGRKKGSANKVTIAAENLFEEESGAIARKAVDMALNGHSQMVKLIMERVVPIKKSSPIKLDGMPKIDSVEKAGEAAEFILQSITSGTISPLDGEILSRVLEKRLRSLQISEIEAELKSIKERLVE